jgi:hypothetical protein
MPKVGFLIISLVLGGCTAQQRLEISSEALLITYDSAPIATQRAVALAVKKRLGDCND